MIFWMRMIIQYSIYILSTVLFSSLILYSNILNLQFKF